MRLNCQSAFDVLIVPQIQNWEEQQQQQQDSLSRSKRPRPFFLARKEEDNMDIDKKILYLKKKCGT